MTRLVFALALAILAFLATDARAETFPPFTGLVVDAADVIPADRKAALEQKLEAFQQKTGRQLVVATVTSLEGDDIQDYGYKLGRAWAVGLKDANNGAILLVAPTERKVGIEVGYGLEGVLTDAYSSVIIHQTILPAFKAGDMPGGIDKGADAIIDLLSQPDDQAKAKEQAAIAAYNKAHQGGDDGALPFVVLFWLIPIGIMFLLMRYRWGRMRGQYYGGHSNLPIWLWAASEILSDRGGGFGGGGWGGGGFTGGGGGSFGGGGASGGW